MMTLHGTLLQPRSAGDCRVVPDASVHIGEDGDRIGSLEAGFEADCLVVRPEKWVGDLPAEQQVSALLYTINPHQIERVYIAGKQVK